MSTMIVPYCERVTMGIEPFNSASNLIFIVCAGVCATLMLRDWAKLRTDSKFILSSLSTLIMLIGIGSAAFHIKPTHVTHAIDLIPIGLFIVVALSCVLKMGFKLSKASVAGIVTVWGCATALASTKPDFLAGSLLYLPTLLIILIMAVLNTQQHRKLVAVFAFFGLGLLIRAIDLPVCNTLSIGTHWIWHACTALAALQTFLLVLYQCKSKDNVLTPSA